MTNSNEFIKQYGLEEAKHFLRMNSYKECFSIHKPNQGFSSDFVNVTELKTAVEAWELIESFNGVEQALRFINENLICVDSIRLEQALKVVQS